MLTKANNTQMHRDTVGLYEGHVIVDGRIQISLVHHTFQKREAFSVGARMFKDLMAQCAKLKFDQPLRRLQGRCNMIKKLLDLW